MIVLTSLLVSENVTGTTYYTISSNDWTNRNTWSTTSRGDRVDKGIYPGAGDDVVIERGFTVTQDINSASCKNFTITSGKFILSTSIFNNNTLTISGNYTQSGGTFDFNSASSGTLSTVYIAGDFTNTTANGSITTSGGGAYNGKIVFNGNSTQTLTFTNSGAATWTTFLVNSGSSVRLSSDIKLTGSNSAVKYYADLIVNGTVDFGAYVINDEPYVNGTTASHFTLNDGASLITANPNGILTSGTTGSVQFLGSRTYASGANYTYNGTSAQVTGNGLTGANNLTISNAGGVTLSNAVGVSGVLNLMNGNLSTTSTNLLSVTSTANSAISGGSSSSFINGPVKWSIGTGTYIFPVGKSTGNYLPFTLTTSAASSPIITVEAFKADAGAAATFDATLASISHTEYWKTILNSGTFTGSVSIDRGSSISPFDVIAGSTSQTGSFTSLNGTPGTTGISNSTAVGTNRYFVLAEKKKPTVSFTSASQSSTSETGTMTVTVQLSAASTQTVTVPFTLSGTATGGGTDYSIIASPITINAGSTTGSTTITIVDDALVEGNETVILTLGTPTNATLGATTVHTATITDNDSPSVPSATLAIDKTSIAENGGVATVTATLSNTSAQTVTIWLNYSGTAYNSSDYNYSSNSITIAAGSLSGTVTVTSVSDCAVEGNETVVVDIGSVTNGTENGSQQVTTTIIDDDVYPTITLSANNLSIPEKGGTAIVTATLSNTFCQSIDIYLNFTGSTATNTTDYNYSSNKITIPSGSLTGTITVSSVNDYLVEGNETVVAGVESTNVAGISTSVSPVTITIVDDDSYSITVTPTSGLVTTEAGGSATFTVVLNALTYNDVTIQLTSSDLTEGTVFPSSLTFTNGNFFTPQTVTITGVDDALADGNIAYTIITSAVTSDDNNFKGIDPSDVSVTNADNEVVSNNIWYRADAGITGNVTSWSDQSGNNINATNIGNVSKVDNSINFNPSLSFSSVNRQFVISGTKNIQSFIVVNKTPDTDKDLAGLIGADGDKGIRLSNSVNELTPVVTPYLSWRGNNNTDDWANETNGGNCRINGVVDANMLHSSKWHIANLTRYQALSGTYYIGGYFSDRSYTGSIAEVMAFDNDPSDGAIESYLALKYGITLGSPSSVVDYASPSGTVIWTGNSTYQNDIAGLGKESTYMGRTYVVGMNYSF